jgi:hypothetical protein
MMKNSNRTSLVLLSLCIAGSAVAQDLTLPDGSPNGEYVNLYAWYKPDSGLNGGSALPDDDTLITSWSDSSANGRDLTRVSEEESRHPAYSTDAYGLVFDGDDFIWAAKEAEEFGTLTEARTIFVIARPDVADGGYVYDSSSILGRNAVFTGDTANPGMWCVYTGTVVLYPIEVTEGVTTLVTTNFAPGAQQVFLDGALAAEGDAEIQDLAGIIFGSRYNLQNQYTGAVSELLVYDRVLDDAERDLIELYLTTKYDAGPPSDCPTDIDGDGSTGGADLTMLLGNWGAAGGAADFDGNGIVDGADLTVLLGGWGPCPVDPCEDVDCDDNDPCTKDTCDPRTGECSHTRIDGCGDGGCGDPASGSCFEPHATPYCSDLECCMAVCEVDIFCCSTLWDQTCVDIASTLSECD